MRSLKYLLLSVIFMAGCDNSSLNITAPGVNISGSGSHSSSTNPTETTPDFSAKKPHAAPDVWLAPNVQSDVLEMFRHPEQWEKVRSRLDVFGVYMLWAYDHPDFECQVCGPNTYANFRNVVPGGAFRWLNEHGIGIEIEAPTLKEYNCDDPTAGAQAVVTTINNIVASGGKVSFVSMDEPFTAGVPSVQDDSSRGACRLSTTQVAERIKNFTNAVRSVHPEVQVGLIEPYPHFTVKEIEGFVLELERQGVQLPFLHIDFFLFEARNKDLNYVADLAELRSFAKRPERGNLPFGVIVFGADGSSSNGYAGDAWATALAIKTAVGVTDHFILQSWAEQQIGNLNSAKTEPHTTPEDDPSSLTGIMLRMFQFFGIPYL